MLIAGLMPSAASFADRIRLGIPLAIMTTLAAWAAYSSSSLVGLREGYWAAISAIIVMQSQVSSTRNAGRIRFLGTAIGAVIGWLCASYWHHHVGIYAAAVGLTVVICCLLNMADAGCPAAVALTVIVLIPRAEPIWRIALLRFLEVSWGIALAIAVQSVAR